MKQVILCLVICSTSISIKSFAQGCVAIRSVGGTCNMNHQGNVMDSSGWNLNVNGRYFRSFRHFVGTQEQKHRVEEGSEVINKSYTVDVSLTRNLNRWWSLTLAMPFISNDRSSLYEHDGRTRHHTQSVGIGDVRFTVYRWLLDPAKSLKANIQFGLGIKLPTGDYRYQDFFYKNDSTEVLGPVDQSIQLGDGGTGISAELNTFYNLDKRFSVYGNFYYLANPREHNGVSTARGASPSATALRYGSSVMSVPDQYMVRAGVNFTTKSIMFSLGMRDECLPAEDLFGGNSGFRRPGYVISIEPGVTLRLKKANVYAYVPVALQRSRTQSFADKKRTQITGVYAQGDAAFADYAVNVGATFKF